MWQNDRQVWDSPISDIVAMEPVQEGTRCNPCKAGQSQDLSSWKRSVTGLPAVITTVHRCWRDDHETGKGNNLLCIWQNWSHGAENKVYRQYYLAGRK